jgi:hypothetical protein
MVTQWFQKHPRKFFVEGTHWLVHQWDAWLSTQIAFNGLYSFTQNNPEHLSLEQISGLSQTSTL